MFSPHWFSNWACYSIKIILLILYTVKIIFIDILYMDRAIIFNSLNEQIIDFLLFVGFGFSNQYFEIGWRFLQFPLCTCWNVFIGFSDSFSTTLWCYDWKMVGKYCKEALHNLCVQKYIIVLLVKVRHPTIKDLLQQDINMVGLLNIWIELLTMVFSFLELPFILVYTYIFSQPTSKWIAHKGIFVSSSDYNLRNKVIKRYW